MTIKENLEQLRDQWRQLGAGAWLWYDFLLLHGRTYEGQLLPARYKAGRPKACFYNARALVLRTRRNKRKVLRYCEGVAMRTDLPFSFQHAWALDPLDEVIDPTLSDAVDYQFYGIIFDNDWLRPEWRWTGVLSDQIGMYRLEVMKAIGPGWYKRIFLPETAALLI